MPLVAAITILVSTLAVPVDAPREFPFLAGLTVPLDRLPKDCRPADSPPGGGPWQGLKNLQVTTNPRLFFIGDRLSKVLDRTKIQAAYTGLYRQRLDPGEGDRTHLGVLGWAFESQAAAKDAHAKLTEFYKQESARMRLWRVNEHVVFVWGDQGTSAECFAALARFVDERAAANK
ncbi:MAG: hypothetical protein K2Y37_14235 [Pirellulales bacterium]|nr:hypothetical protein [Pirellulales bacterium]